MSFISDTLKHRKKVIFSTFLTSLLLFMASFSLLLCFIYSDHETEGCYHTAHKVDKIKDTEDNYVLTWRGFVKYNKNTHSNKNVYVQYKDKDIHRSNWVIEDGFCMLDNNGLKKIKAGIIGSFAYSFLLTLIVTFFILIKNYKR